MELTVTNRSRAYPGRSSEDSKVDEVQYVVLKVCYLCTSGSVVEYRLAKARVAGSNPVSCSQRDRKRVIRWMALFSMFEPCRARTVRSTGSDLFIAEDIMCEQNLFVFSEKTSNF